MKSEIERFEMPPVKKGLKNKIKEWIKRFLPAEIAGSMLAIIASYLTLHSTNNKILAAYAGAIGDTAGFYIVIIVQSSLAQHKQLKSENKRFTFHTFLHVFKNMLIEFGPAEILDSLFLRPFFMYIFPVLLHNYSIGILAGKVASDIGFYIPVIISHELRVLLSKKSK